jgi:hypothetical protein
MSISRFATRITLAVTIGVAGAACVEGADLNTSGIPAARLEPPAKQLSATPVGSTPGTPVLDWALDSGGLNDLRGVYSALNALPQYVAAGCAAGATCVSFKVLPSAAQLAATDRVVGIALDNPVPDAAIQASYTEGLDELLAGDRAMRASDIDSYETDRGNAVADLQKFVNLLRQAGVATG